MSGQLPPRYYPGMTLPDEDCLPHGKAMWRDHCGSPTPPPQAGAHRVSVDLTGSGELIEVGHGDVIGWGGVKRWRFGWPPKRDR